MADQASFFSSFAVKTSICFGLHSTRSFFFLSFIFHSIATNTSVNSGYNPNIPFTNVLSPTTGDVVALTPTLSSYNKGISTRITLNSKLLSTISSSSRLSQRPLPSKKLASSFTTAVKSNNYYFVNNTITLQSNSSITPLPNRTILKNISTAHYQSTISKPYSTLLSPATTSSVSKQNGTLNISNALIVSTTKSITNSSIIVSSSSLVCPSVVTYSPICTPDIIFSTVTSFINLTTKSVNASYPIVNVSSSAILFSSSAASLVITKTSSRLPFLSTVFNFSATPALIITSAVSKNISTSIKIINVTTSTRHIHNNTMHVINPPLCDKVASDFTDAMTNLTKCILLHLHPMRVCYKCTIFFDALQNRHRSIFNNCGNRLITSYNEQYQVIPKMFTAQDQTWDALACEKCYQRDSGGSLFTPEFREFQQIYTKTMDCFQNNTVDNLTVSKNSSFTNVTNGHKVCYNCKDIYKEMQKKFQYYKDSEGETVTRWCADINVAVNSTRHMWGMVYKCGAVTKDLESIIALTCFFCFLPIVFYVGAKLHSDVKERKNANRYYDSD